LVKFPRRDEVADEGSADEPSSIEMLIFRPGSDQGRAAAPAPGPAEPAAPSLADRIPRSRRPAEADTEFGPADDPRIFGLSGLLAHDELERRGFDVEARPPRSYRLRHSSAGSIRPEYHTVVLTTGAAGRGRLRAHGLGLMLPPHTVHTPDSTSAPVGGDCELTPADHVHIRRAEVAAQDPLRTDRVRQIVAWAKPGQDNTGVVRVLRAALAGQDQQPPERIPPRVPAGCVTSIHQAEMVMLGDDALTRLDSRYVLERTTIPAGALLADDEDLARRYVELHTGAHDDPAALVDFLGDLIAAAAGTTEENLLGYADGLPEQRATLLGLFGLVSVDPATSIMVIAAAGSSPRFAATRST
jgi:hypothetical protein